MLFEILQKNNNKWIVVFNGMGDRYERHLNALDDLSENVGANVLAFNYRGVGSSSGKPSSIKDWVEDGEYALKYLKEKGVKPENIVIYGHSLGGGIAAEVYEKQNIKSALVVESTPSSLHQGIKSKRGALAALAAKTFNWDFNSYKVVKDADQASKNRIAVVVNRRDPTVRYQEASLYKKLGKKNVSGYERIKIGEKHEGLEKTSVKKGVKTSSKTQKEEEREIPEEAKQYREKYGELRKKGIHTQLRHPHDRIMDMPAKPLKGDLQPFQEKFAKEDKEAYQAFVKVCKDFLSIGESENPNL